LDSQLILRGLIASGHLARDCPVRIRRLKVFAFDNPAIYRHDWNGKVLDYSFLKEPDLFLIVLD
jgi:hypothetical protein